MYNLRTAIILAGLVLSGLWTTKAKAQFDAMFTQYTNNEIFINPAYSGSNDVVRAALLHRQQWVGFNGRPVTTTFSLKAPMVKNTMALGVCYLNEKIGVLNRNLIYASYSYRIKTGRQGYLHFGLMGGVHLQFNKVSEIMTITPDDPHFSGGESIIATPNFGFGMYFRTDKFYAGFSIPRLLDDHINFSPDGLQKGGVQFKLRSFHYYLAAGRMFIISKEFKMKPHMMMKIAANAPIQLDINADMLIIDKIWAGFGYRTSADISMMMGVQIIPSLLISYSYDYPISSLREYTTGTHEIVIAYVLDNRWRKRNQALYF